jgi:hypothetical protein
MGRTLMHIFSQNLRIQTCYCLKRIYGCYIDCVLKIITKNTVTHTETAKSANMGVYVMFVRLFYKTFLLPAKCHLELHIF